MLALIGLAGATTVLCYVWMFGIDVPTGHDWDLLTTLLSWRTSGPTAASLLAFQNEHRIVATRVIDSVLLPLAGGDLRAAYWFNAALVIATLVGLLPFVRRERAHALFSIFLYAAIAGLVVGCSQWQNLLEASRLPLLLLPFVLVLTIWCLCFVRSHKLCLGVVAPLLALASLCQANGIIVWLAVIPAVSSRLSTWARRSQILAAAGLVVLTLVAGALYFVDLPTVLRPSLQAVFDQPARFIRFFLAVLGSPFSNPLAVPGPVRWTSVIVGAVGLATALAAFAAVWRRGPAERRSPRFVLATGLILFSGASALVIAAARFDRSLPEFSESRYSSSAVYFYVGVMLLLFATIARDLPAGRKTGSLRIAFLVVCALTMGATTWGDRLVWTQGRDLMLARLRAKASLNLSLALPDRPELDAQARAAPSGLEKLLEALESRRLWISHRFPSILHNQLQDDAVVGNVDEVMERGNRVILRGWSRLPDGLPADAVVALLPDERRALVPVAMSEADRSPRPDLATVFGKDVVLKSGWTLELSRADYDRRPVLGAYSARRNAFSLIPFEHKPRSN